MARFGIMGGTFDPVHYAHTSLAIATAKQLGLDYVLMMPAYIQPFKRNQDVSNEAHRVNMLNLAIETEGGDLLRLSDYELSLGGISYTYDTIMHFKETNPKDDIWFIMGSDSFVKINEWHRGEELLKSCNFAVGTRPTNDIDKVRADVEDFNRILPGEVVLIDKLMLPISSTMVRNAVMEDKPISGMVTPLVEEYIYENKLYI